MSLDYSTKIGFHFFESGGQEKPEINYNILSYHWGPVETLSVRKDKNNFSVLYSPMEEKIISLEVGDGQSTYKIAYDSQSKSYKTQPELPQEDTEKLLQLGLKKFVDFKEKCGLEEKIRQYHIAAKAKDILNSFYSR